jgi:hypothetical protein
VKAQRVNLDIHEAVLERWWWRRLVFVEFDEATHTTQHRMRVPEHPSYGFLGEWAMWHQKDELVAFRFEMLRRTAFSDLPEWHSLPGWLAAWILGVLAPKKQRAVCGLFQPVPPGYESLNWLWDLTASDESLCKAFLSRINEVRGAKGLPVTNDPFAEETCGVQTHAEKRRGKRNRQVSWLAVEAYDVKQYQVRPLTDGERSRLSKASRDIKAFEGPVREAMTSAEQFTPAANRDVEGENVYVQFIRENFVQRFASKLQQR